MNYIVLFGDLATLASAVHGAYMKPEDIIYLTYTLTVDWKSVYYYLKFYSSTKVLIFAEKESLPLPPFPTHFRRKHFIFYFILS